MIQVTGTSDWSTTHPGAYIGLLEISGVANNISSPELNQRKREAAARLHTQYSGFCRQDFQALPVMAAYVKYYRSFDKTYHVLLQLESIVIKSRALPDVSPLVDANFIAELETLVLTAGHDISRLEQPVVIDVSRPGDEMINMSGETKHLRPGDMVMRDRHGICCSILYGQDNLSPITRETRGVLYVAYAPAGVPEQAVVEQLQLILENIHLFSPSAALEQSRLIKA